MLSFGDDYYANEKSLGSRLRRRRFALVRDMLGEISRRSSPVRILDIGGTELYWRPHLEDIEALNCEVTLVNLIETEAANPRFTSMKGDATGLPFADNSFDFVHSNSTIEHVGRWPEMRAMAGEVRRLAPSFYLQVPYFWFPVEPHFRAPFFHWLPEQVRARLLMRLGLGYGGRRRETFDEAMTALQSSQLLDVKQLRALFPDADIRRERFLGFTKSLLAVRYGGA
ncbi:methyltransferase domain-containing protein [Parvibaculum sp.]|uniref:class I SAM-dependent methyltransferase n=1 Tax=Parvibaculum sp. TaxID=2024848 RepID=UPI00349FDBC6